MKFSLLTSATTLSLFALIVIGCETKPDTLVTGGYDPAEMDAAIVEAKSSVDVFLKAMQSGDGDSFAIKEPVTDENGTEHFWLTDVTYADGKFSGLIGNDAGIVENVKLGDKRVVAKNGISDWMYMKDGKMKGNFTMRVLLKSASPEERAEYEDLLGE